MESKEETFGADVVLPTPTELLLAFAFMPEFVDDATEEEMVVC